MSHQRLRLIPRHASFQVISQVEPSSHRDIAQVNKNDPLQLEGFFLALEFRTCWRESVSFIA